MAILNYQRVFPIMSHSFPSLLQPSAEVEVECGVKHIARRQHRPLGFLSIPHSSLSVTKHHMFGLEYFMCCMEKNIDYGGRKFIETHRKKAAYFINQTHHSYPCFSSTICEC